jgi:hypothetical protein
VSFVACVGWLFDYIIPWVSVCLRGDAFGVPGAFGTCSTTFCFSKSWVLIVILIKTFANLDWDISRQGFASHLDLIWLDNRPRTDPART